jgi:hypothetical protein
MHVYQSGWAGDPAILCWSSLTPSSFGPRFGRGNSKTPSSVHVSIHQRPKRTIYRPSLTPVALNQDPSTTTPRPVMRHPATVRAGRSLPSSGDPYVTVSIPRVIAGNPNIIAPGHRSTPLDDRARRPNPDKDLGAYSRADGQHPRQKESNECLAKHIHPFLPLSQLAHSGPLPPPLFRACQSWFNRNNYDTA